MIDEKIIQNVVLVAERIMNAESRHDFEVYAIDDSEHIPRMARMADAVRDFLVGLGVPSGRCDQIEGDLLEHARWLYVAEWMRPQPGEDEEDPPREEDGIRSFNKHLNPRKKRTTP